MNKYFNKYHRKVIIGTHYDWVSAGNPVSGFQVIAPNTMTPYGLLSHGNPFRNGHYVGGGAFMCSKVSYEAKPGGGITVYRPQWGKAYSGSFSCAMRGPSGDLNLGSQYTNSAMTNLKNTGSIAFGKMRPDKPDFSFALSTLEMKDMVHPLKNAVKRVRDKVRHVDRTRRKNGRSGLSNTAQHFLALEFGWAPIISDVRKFIKAQANKQARLAQLIRDEGKPIRRQSKIDASESSVIEDVTRYNSGSGGALAPGFVTQCYGPGPSFKTLRKETIMKTWCSGQFRYHLPPGPKNVVWKKKMLRRIMGFRVTPAVVYNLMPWTWLVDYFTDLGAFVDAVSPGVADRLAADQFFVMRTDMVSAFTECSGMYQGSKTAGHYVTATASSVARTTRKLRAVSSPFGFGTLQSSLGPKQLAILGALGISRLP